MVMLSMRAMVYEMYLCVLITVSSYDSYISIEFIRVQAYRVRLLHCDPN